MNKNLKELVINFNDLVMEEEKEILTEAKRSFCDVVDMCCNFLEPDDLILEALNKGLEKLSKFRDKTGL